MNGQMLLGPNGLVYAIKEKDKDKREKVHIVWGGLPLYTFHCDDALEKKLGIALLANQGVLQYTICELFDITRQTVRNILAVYTELGAQGLQDYRVGREGIGKDLHEFVIARYIQLNGIRGYQNMILAEVAKKKEEGVFCSSLSRSKLQKLIRAHKEETKKKRDMDQLQAGLKDQRQEQREERRRRKEQDSGDGEDQLELEQKGEPLCVEHGGAAAIIPLLGLLGLKEALPEDSGQEKRLYSVGELAVSYAALNAAQLAEVEQDFKLVAGYQMGGIIARKRLPSLAVYRERIPRVVEQMDMQEVMLQSARSAVGVFGPTRVAYVDGHFMPYYGEAETLYGYNTQRRLAMHGREYVYIHDHAGIPIYASLSDGYRKMQYYVESLDTALRGIYGVGEKEILEVFDRGGYSKQFCVAISERILFVCWRSDAREVPDIPAGEWVDVAVENQGNTVEQIAWKQMKAWERTRTVEADGKRERFRDIWIKSGRKVSAVLSNDFERPLEELVAALVGRWGNQENMFKDLKDHGIDRIHSYRKEPYSEEYLYSRGLEDRQQGIQHEIANPNVREINKELARLRGEKKKLEQKILTAEKNKKGEEATVLRKKAAGLGRQIEKRISKRETMPKKVLMIDRIAEDEVVRLCDGKKMFFDWLKMNAIWAKKMLVEAAKPFYKDLRDVNKFVISVLQSRTYVHRSGEALEVIFPPQRSPNGKAALEALCEFLNKKEPFDLDLSFNKINFHVGEKH
jgi:hypothetical protein